VTLCGGIGNQGEPERPVLVVTSKNVPALEYVLLPFF
jgi:hypothetical protein